MPSRKTMERARAAKRRGKAPTTQAGEFVREEIHHVRSGKHGVRSPQQAIAIGLSKARRAGVRLPPPEGRSGADGRRSEAGARSRRTGARKASRKRGRGASRASSGGARRARRGAGRGPARSAGSRRSRSRTPRRAGARGRRSG